MQAHRIPHPTMELLRCRLHVCVRGQPLDMNPCQEAVRATKTWHYFDCAETSQAPMAPDPARGMVDTLASCRRAAHLRMGERRPGQVRTACNCGTHGMHASGVQACHSARTRCKFQGKAVVGEVTTRWPLGPLL
jgi:hypothetical protein